MDECNADATTWIDFGNGPGGMRRRQRQRFVTGNDPGAGTSHGASDASAGHANTRYRLPDASADANPNAASPADAGSRFACHAAGDAACHDAARPDAANANPAPNADANPAGRAAGRWPLHPARPQRRRL